MNRLLNKTILGLAFLLIAVPSFTQNKDLPQRPAKKMAVNDFADLLSPGDKAQLEHKLRAIYDTTQLSIVVITVKSLNGYEVNDFATRTFESWGIGDKGKNNGFLILVKVKSKEEKGKVYITTGYGVESFMTDALASRIVEKEILPSFKENNYAEGLNKAASTIVALAKGEYTPGHYMKKKSKVSSNLGLIIVVVVIIIIIAAVSNRSSNNRHMSSAGSDIPFWLLMGGLLGGNRSGGFGDFSSGGGDFGSDSDSDFGGFGGGNTGGGGAGGEW